MALTLEAETDRVVTLPEFLDYVRAHVDSRDEASVLAAAPMLRALANNRSFLRDELHKQLAAFRTPDRGSTYVSQTFSLGTVKDLNVRANVWHPRGHEPPTANTEGEQTLYGLPHDHSFGFLTVGYWGPGYWTAIYEYDGDRVGGVPGERVDLQFLEKTTLPVGKVMYYRPCRDVHEQGYPPAFSISLNLAVIRPNVADRDQYYFDLENQRIVAFSGPVQAGRLLLCEVAGDMGDERTLDLLSGARGAPRSLPVFGSRAYRRALARRRGAQAEWRSGSARRPTRTTTCARRRARHGRASRPSEQRRRALFPRFFAPTASPTSHPRSVAYTSGRLWSKSR